MMKYDAAEKEKNRLALLKQAKEEDRQRWFEKQKQLEKQKKKLQERLRKIKKQPTFGRTIISREEKMLAAGMECIGLPFKTQVQIGKYVADFVLPGKIVVEVVGKHHYIEQRKEQERTSFLKQQGYKVVIIDAYNVRKNVSGVASAIRSFVNRASNK